LSGLDLADFFARHVDGTDELPLADALAAFGLEMHLRPTDGIRSYTVTAMPRRASTSAAISPAGPPPMIAACRGVCSFMMLRREPRRRLIVRLFSLSPAPPRR